MDQKSKDRIKYVILLLVCLVFIFFIIKYGRKLSHMNIRVIKRWLFTHGKYADLSFILIYSLKPVFLVIPSSVLSIFAGRMFGPVKATLLSMIGCFFSGTLAFFLARILGKSFVEKVLKGKALKLDNDIEKHGLLIMLLMRASFIFPYDGLSYAAGLSKMKYRDFIVGTMIGVLPEMVSYAYIGKSIFSPFSYRIFLPVLGLLGMAILFSFIYKNFKKQKT